MERYARLITHKGKQRHVAVALLKGKVLAIGFNNYNKTHPRQRDLARIAGQPKREYLHAEIACLLRCRAVPDELVVVRVNRKGELRPSNPCPVCRAAINLINPKMKVRFS